MRLPVLTYFLIRCPLPSAPVSEPLLNISCLRDGGADFFCRTDPGEDSLFSILVNGESLLEDSTSSRTEGKVSEVNATVKSPGPWNITCSVRNRVNDRQTNNTQVKCPAPLSNPVLELSCLHNGSLQISCSVQKGSDPIFSLSVNTTLLLENVKTEKKMVNVASPSPGYWDVHCAVRNSLGGTNVTKNHTTCPVPLSDPVLELSCLRNGSLQISCSVENGSDPIFFSLLVNTTLLVENVTTEKKMVNVVSPSPGPLDVQCAVRNSLGKRHATENYTTCPVPLSVPVVKWSCQNDGSAKVTCEVERGSNATYTWTVGGKLIHWNTVPNLIINASEFASGAINVSCSAENSVSKKSGNDTKIFCEAPVSAPLLNASCLPNGSTLVTCWVLSGTDPTFSLTVNGDVITLPNTSSSCCGLNYTMSSGGPWNISCSVRNLFKVYMTNISSQSCSESTCLDCFQKSIIGGVVALIVTTSPFLIASFYIGRNTRDKQS
ncbi:Fc receptor-like protein 5 [Rhinoderma darwinii]|uniref:Fc receptor-like protein 5 n=1 Tax=Rhinoderma darwinii TaxID=43563 RepID=UPI003F66354D